MASNCASVERVLARAAKARKRRGDLAMPRLHGYRGPLPQPRPDNLGRFLQAWEAYLDGKITYDEVDHVIGPAINRSQLINCRTNEITPLPTPDDLAERNCRTAAPLPRATVVKRGLWRRILAALT